MKIGLISPSWPNEVNPNGIVKYVDLITKGLVKQGHACHIFAGSIDNDRAYPNVTDLSATSPMFKPSLIKKIIRKIFLRESNFRINREQVIHNLALCVKRFERENYTFDIIEMEETCGWAMGLAPIVTAPVVVKLHGPWLLNGNALGVNCDAAFNERVHYEGLCIQNADGVIAPSACVLNEVKSFYKIDLPEAMVIHNPIEKTPDDDKWSYEKCIKNQVLFVGRFDEHKGGDIIIDAFYILSQKNKHARLIFAGPDRGVRIKGTMMSINEYIDQRIPDEEVKKRIVYLGQVAGDKVSQLRKQSHVTVMASRWENFANTVLESLAMGCPTVATNSGGTPEIVTDGITGILAEANNPEDIAVNLSRVLEDVVLAKKLARNSSVDMENRFDKEVLAKKTAEFYESIIAKNDCGK